MGGNWQDQGHERSNQRWPHDPGDGGVHGESHRINDDGSGHHTLWREDGSHISWDTDRNGDYSGGGHTHDPGGSNRDW